MRNRKKKVALRLHQLRGRHKPTADAFIAGDAVISNRAL